MQNYVTGYVYTGQNAVALECAGVERVLTFKQAIKLPGVTGKKLKGLKKVATLQGFKKVKDKETGKQEKKPFYFTVFDANDVLARAA